ncbi:lipoate--protein ligase family protein [bacterium]|nr:lipoate--protein ligase family protein [bacterium]
MEWDELWKHLRGCQWQYISDGSHSGQENMDRDERLMQEAACPILRIYTWDRPTVSLGRNQSERWLDKELCERLGVDVVRRPTGGRALLHMDDEITYAVILPDVGRVSVRAAFEGIAAHLAASLRRLGLDVSASLTGSAPSSQLNPHCGEVLTAGEVCWQGRKLVGSAQMRSGVRLLQHGSMLRYGDRGLLRQLMPEAHSRLTLEDIGRADLQAEDIIIAWQEELQSASV